jgi:hypothetical protein
LQQSPLGALVPECWKLAPERAVTLRPDSAGLLRVSQGRVWATLAGPHQGPANDWGDVVLRGGEQLPLQPGQQVVLEVYADAVNEPAYFSWEPARPGTVPPIHPASPWGDAWARPLLQQADQIVPALAFALGRRVMQVGALLSWLVPRRGRVMPPMEFNQP